MEVRGDDRRNRQFCYFNLDDNEDNKSKEMTRLKLLNQKVSLMVICRLRLHLCMWNKDDQISLCRYILIYCVNIEQFLFCN